MYNDGIANEFEEAHQKGLARGFDLGWSYKGRFDRQIIRDIIDELEEKIPKDAYAIDVLNKVLKTLAEHSNNREFIT
jgi:hypothetical protein